MSAPGSAPRVLAPIDLGDDVVVFDYGEVISRSPSDDDRARLLERAGVDRSDTAAVAAFWAAYWAHRDRLDEGTASIGEYWAAVAGDLGVGWGPLDVHDLWAIDYRGWISVDTATLAVIHALADGGTRLALLSNAGADFGTWLRSGSFGPLFERVFVSGELGLLKPEAAIYEHVLRELDIPPERFLFVDNKSVNVDGAIAVGGRGHVFTDAASLERWLRAQAR